MDNKIAVFVPEKFPKAFVAGKRAIPFKPTTLQVEAVEKELAQFLRSDHATLLAKFKNYYRQYTGLDIKGAEKIIRGNFLCQVDNDRWKKEWVMVQDGGDCFFNFTYDLKNLKITSFSINGVS
jgi:hypothetical protein